MKFVVFLPLLLIFVPSVPAQELDWWQSGAIYQIYPRSFKDSDGDGIGDLKGITSKLDYLVELGVNTVWLSPIFKSPMKDFGYDVSDFREIDPIFGTMADFEELAAEMKKRNLNLVLDFVPNHSSDEHEWFVKSVAKDPVYDTYYVWRDPKGYDGATPIPPNNWLSVFGGSAWEWNEQRKQFYLHQFHKGQPDLNYRNSAVIDELKAIIQFWLEKGADGFRVDAIAHMFEDPEFKDEPLSNRPDVTEFEYDYLNHIYTKNYDETYGVLRQLRILMDDYSSNVDNKHKLMLTEAYEAIDLVMKYYGTKDEPIADLPFNFEYLGRYNPDLTGVSLKEAADLWLENMPEGKWANWVVGNHDQVHRIGSRVDSTNLIDAINMVNLLMPGTSITYYGEEIGMLDGNLTYEETQDPWGCNFGPDGYDKVSRDPSRTPMQWDDTTSAGFSANTTTWLPVNDDYTTLNVKSQQAATTSHLKIYKQLTNLRKEVAIQKGSLSYPLVNNDFFSMMRRTEEPGAKSYIVLANFGDGHFNVDFATEGVPAEATVEISSLGAWATPGTKVETSDMHMMPKEGYVLSFVAVDRSASAALQSSLVLIAAALYFFF